MEKLTTEIKGLFIIKPNVFRDARGYFLEQTNHKKLSNLGLECTIAQTNQSKSIQHTVRGLHSQPGQGKIVSAVNGCIYDVVVDIRPGSETFGKWQGFEISDDNNLTLWIPDGFLHGFQVISDTADVMYHTTDYYNQQTEFGVKWNDADLNIIWPNMEKAILSDRDIALQPFNKIAS